MLESMFKHGPAIRPDVCAEWGFWGGDSRAVVDNALLAIDSSSATGVMDLIGGRPCVNITNSGSGATDLWQGQATAAFIQPQAGKEILVVGSFRMTTVTQDWNLGLMAIDTNVFSTAPTDYIVLEKLAAATKFSIKSRKASGTAETWTLEKTIAVDTWYDFALRIIRDPSTAGKGILQVYMGESLNAKGTMDCLFNGTVATQLPDTVDLSPTLGWRAGSAANVSGYVGHFGVKIAS